MVEASEPTAGPSSTSPKEDPPRFPDGRPIPEGYLLHTESTTSILLPTSSLGSTKLKSTTSEKEQKDVFLNPVQEYNRDLSIVAIRTWSEIFAGEKSEIWDSKRKKRGGKGKKRGREPAEQRGQAEDVNGHDAREVEVTGEQGKDDALVGDQGPHKKRKLDLGEEPAVPEVEVDLSVQEISELQREKCEVDLPLAGEAASASEPPNAPRPEDKPKGEPKRGAAEVTQPEEKRPPPYKFTLFEGLSATGLRSLRYAKEIPLLRWVLANDISSKAVANIKMNADFNGLGPQPGPSPSDPGSREAAVTEESAMAIDVKPAGTIAHERTPKERLGKVRVNEGDCCAVMYSNRTPTTRFDVVDLDPYGTATPFIDGAVQCVNDGGLLCVTCTDLAVLAGSNYPEKCYSNYGGAGVKAEFSHEVALRLVLHTIAISAARYGRYIVPLLSLSIDFYIRVFVRVYTGPKEVKNLASNTSMVYVCQNCQTTYLQPLGRTSQSSTKSNNINYNYHNAVGPPVGNRCEECGGTLHLGGPMWSGPIQNEPFIAKMLEHVDVSGTDAETGASYGTAARIRGMLNVAKEELPDPFYFTPSRIAGLFHCVSPSLANIASALLHAGYKVSRSHAAAGSVKTNAPRSVVHDIYRSWIANSPIPVKDTDVEWRQKLLNGPKGDRTPAFEANFTNHPDTEARIQSNVKITRYQVNPLPNWGPASRAK